MGGMAASNLIDRSREYPETVLADFGDPNVLSNRVAAMVRANAERWFWLPCPLCGMYFGGHEHHFLDGFPDSIPSGQPGLSTGICPPCQMAGRGRPVTW